MGKADRRIGWGWLWLASGIGAAIAVIAAPELPKWSVLPLIAFAGVSFTLAAYYLHWFQAPFPVGTFPRTVLVLAVIWLLLACLAWKVYPRIDVVMSFEGSDLAQVKISNKSNVDVQGILYEVGVVDLDQPFLHRDPNFPDTPYAPLPIPVQKIDFINAGDFRSAIVLPMDLATSVHAGDHLFGIAWLTCPKCEDDRGYWVYIVHRHGGWFAPMHGTWKSRNIPLSAIVTNPERELEKLAPKSERIPIT